ncbi:MAG: hypothetical protein K2K45_06305 [Muribaculaceae bacterium]|nr:hypothetical protein [Muribaculaceae bacterium]
MNLRNFILGLFAVILPLVVYASSDILPIGDSFPELKSYAVTDRMENLMPLLDGETIRFSGFKPDRNITMFEYEVPDTIWIKERPKKNPKEGKHYTLRHKYRGVTVEEGIYYKSTKEVTPVIELVGSLFLVTSIDKIGESGYYTKPSFNVHLTNTATGERIIWYIRPGSTSYDNDEYIIHLVGLNERLGLKGKTLYSATKGGYGESKYTNVNKHICTGTDAVIDCTSYSPKFKIIFTTIDDNNREKIQILPLSSPSSYSSSVIWFDESQADIALESNKIYEIDYTINLYTPTENFPFSFKSILGSVSDSYSTKVGQKISPSRYGSDELSPYDYIKDGTVFFIGDRIKVRGTDYYKGVLDGKAFYIPADKVYLPQESNLKLDSLMNSSQAVRDEFFEFAKALSYYTNYQKLEKSLNTIKGFSSKGISIPNWGVYDMSEYTDGTGIRFTFHNPTNKTIKYVNIGFVGYNAVDDRVGKAMTKKCIGPIEPDETASYDFEYAWFTDIVDYAKISSLSVQYMDGTTKVVSNPSSVVWSDEVHNGLNSRLEKFNSKLINSDE